MDRKWIVLLEATGSDTESPLGVGALRRLMEELAEHAPTALHDSSRYALQFTVESPTAAEALFTATVRWQDAVHRLEMPAWELARAEVMTTEEYQTDCLDDNPSDPADAPTVGQSSGDELLQRVFTDSLTGLATRELFRDRVRVALTDPSQEVGLAMVLIDVDGFAAVNRAVGYAAGDEVLVALANRLTRVLTGAVATARVGGDAFAALIPNPPGRRLEDTAGDLLDGFRTPLDIGGRRLGVTASIGVAPVVPVVTTLDADMLIRDALAAMGAAKAAGGDAYRIFEPGLPTSPIALDLDDDPAPDRMAYVVLLQRAAVAANESPSLEIAAASVLQQVCALTGWAAGHLWTADPTGTLTATGVWNAGAPARLGDFQDRIGRSSVAAASGLPGLVLATGQPAWTEVVSGERHATEAGAVEAGIRTTFAFPVLAQQEVVAVLEFFSPRLLSPDDLLTDVMASVGAQLGRVVERRRAETALSASEERYRTMAELAPLLIWRAGPDARCSYFNSTWLEFTGRSMADELGDGWAEGVHPDDLAACLDTYRRAFERREPFEMDYRLRRADGEYRWLLDRGRPIGDGATFAGYVGACVDVTDKRQAELEIRDREARFRSLVQCADMIIAVLAADGTVVEEYVGAFDLGYVAEQKIGLSVMDKLHPDDLERATTELAHILSRPGPGLPFECRVRHADGSWRWVEATANNLLDDPTVHGIVLTVTDITERKKAEAAEVESATHLREAQALARTGSWWRDVASGTVFWSDELYRILGRSRSDQPARAEDFLAAVHPDDRLRVAAMVADAHAGRPRPLALRVVRPGGEVCRVYSECSIIRDATGTPVRIFGTLLEIDGDVDGDIDRDRSMKGGAAPQHSRR